VGEQNTVRPERSGESGEVEGPRERAMFYLYILECGDGTLYVGHTDNLDERMRQQDAGTADSYTSSRRPLRLIHVEEFETRYEALAVERRLKGWSRAKKLAYVECDWTMVSSLAKGKHAHERLR
jgi:predicted GIY-YIG superfamily endonuclease